MKTVKLSDFYPYDKDKGGVQELPQVEEYGEVFQRPDKHDLREHESVVEEMDVGLLYRHKR